MSFAALLRGTTGAAQPSLKRQYKNEKVPVEKTIEQGKQVHAFLEEGYGHERASEILHKAAERANGSQPRLAGASQPSKPADLPGGSQPREENKESGDEDTSSIMPYGFWRLYMEDGLGTPFTKRKGIQLMRCFKYYAQRREAGATTPAAMRHERKVGSCRGLGGSMNARKVAGLGFA